MAFERLEVRAASGRRGLPASISLSCRSGERPAVIVALTAPLVSEAGYRPQQKFHALIGTGDDLGKVRIQEAQDGLLTPRMLKNNSFLLDLGYVETIGTAARKKKFTTARVVVAGVVEIDVPDFSDGEDADEDADPAPPVRPSSPPPARPSIAAAPTPKNGASETLHGVTIDLTLDSETVTFKGKSTEVTTRQARLIRLLARPRPTPVAELFLINALWDGTPPVKAGDQLRQMCADLQQGLSPIGLNLALVKGVGYQLKDL